MRQPWTSERPFGRKMSDILLGLKVARVEKMSTRSAVVVLPQELKVPAKLNPHAYLSRIMHGGPRPTVIRWPDSLAGSLPPRPGPEPGNYRG
jgi:hypothetical protein